MTELLTKPIRKVQEYFHLHEMTKSEVGSIHWFYYLDIIPSKEIYEIRKDFCEKMEWDYNDPDDTYAGDIGAIYWWNMRLLDDVRSWLQNQYPREHTGMKLLSELIPDVLDRKFEKKYASAEERQRFYNSLDWAYVKYLRFHIDRGICVRCGDKPTIPEVNHLYPITSEMYPELFIRNLDITRVETLCPSCHMEFHRVKINADTHFE